MKTTYYRFFFDLLEQSKTKSGINLNDTKIFSYDINSSELLKKEKECISNIFKIIEKNDLFSRENATFNGYARFFENITLKKINFPTFFSDLDHYKLFNLKDAILNLITKDETILIDQFIVVLEEASRLFKNNEATIIEILNLKISKEVKKRYIDLNNTKVINLKNIKDVEIQTYLIKKQIKS